MGRIVDVIVDREGTAHAAVIDFGGFLGVGSRKIVVDSNAMHFGSVPTSGQHTLELTRDQVTAAPEYKQDAPIIVLGASGRSQPWHFTTERRKIAWPRGPPESGDRSLTTSAIAATPLASHTLPLRQPRWKANPIARKSHGLDWFMFCLADVQTGFGPFVSVYLTTQKWTQVEIGLVLLSVRAGRPPRTDTGRRPWSMPRAPNGGGGAAPSPPSAAAR